MFDNRDITAGLSKNTQPMLLPKGRSGSLLEYLHLDLPDIMKLPLVKNGTEKVSPGFSCHSTVAYATISIRLLLNEGQKTQVLCLDFLEKTVYLGWV